MLFKRQRDGGLSAPKLIAGKAFIEGRHDQLLSPEDGKAKMQLVSSRCIVSDLYGERNPATIDALREMSGKVVKLHAKKTALAEDVLSAGASALSAQAMMELLAED